MQTNEIKQPSEEESSKDDSTADLIIDASFCVIYFICFVTTIVIATRNFLKFPQMVNQANIVIVIMIALTLLIRLICLLYSVFYFDQEDHFGESIENGTLESFAYFELPFCLLNMATVIHLFEW